MSSSKIEWTDRTWRALAVEAGGCEVKALDQGRMQRVCAGVNPLVWFSIALPAVAANAARRDVPWCRSAAPSYRHDVIPRVRRPGAVGAAPVELGKYRGLSLCRYRSDASFASVGVLPALATIGGIRSVTMPVCRVLVLSALTAPSDRVVCPPRLTTAAPREADDSHQPSLPVARSGAIGKPTVDADISASVVAAAIQMEAAEREMDFVQGDYGPGWLCGYHPEPVHACGGDPDVCKGRCPEAEQTQNERLDWVIVGGESGPGARPFDVAWARSVVRQCREAGVACFVKQLGARPCEDQYHDTPESALPKVATSLFLSGKGGDPAEWPADLRVREFPA